eukprot:gnl/MRDRNA2_/MRDRNA2_130118_c0_seq1.p1 gnl/MRDRNA2_/MRDRNA2_130118_c0~~gnl/MRDRNA2_/MRDRNA2_130118_c0_seq1.p1  ORF type:complete len:1083 (-),score=142.53 gnl/MRDRNA2_/MRDRNA2_130118_c0_seq1:23-3271(-)
MVDASHAQTSPQRKKNVTVPRGQLSPQVLVSRLGELASKSKPHKSNSSRPLGGTVLGRGAELTLSPRGVLPSDAGSRAVVPGNASSSASTVQASAARTLLPIFEPQDSILPVMNDLNSGDSKPIITPQRVRDKNKSKTLNVGVSSASTQALPTLLETDGNSPQGSPRNRKAAAAERCERLQASFTATTDEVFDMASWFRHRQTHKPNQLLEKKLVMKLAKSKSQNVSDEEKDKPTKEAFSIVPGLTEATVSMAPLDFAPSEIPSLEPTASRTPAFNSNKVEIPVEIPKDGEAELPRLPVHAGKEELGRALDCLNLYRSLSGLQPVILDDVCMKACAVLSQVFLTHEPIHRHAGHPQLWQARSCSEKLSSLLGRNQHHFAVLQGEATLTGMVQAGVHAGVCPRGNHGVDNRKAPRPPNEVLTQKLRQRAEQPTAKIVDPSKLRHGRVVTQLEEEPGIETAMQPPVHDPEGYDLGLFWSLATNLNPSCLPDRSASRASTVNTKRTRSARRRAESAATSISDGSFWGDPSGALSFRRFALDPSLERIGLARVNDIGIIWTLPALDAISAMDQNIAPKQTERQLPEATCFPPPGIMPMELFVDPLTPWSIMPCSKRFQPTAATKVRMWRVQINKPKDDASPSSRAWSADRIEEVPFARCAIDCSARGNAFCVIFWPRPFNGVSAGDQYEVLLSGLTGMRTEFRFFHEFVATGQADNALLTEARKLFQGHFSLGNSQLWKTPTFFDDGMKLKIPHRMSLRLLPPEEQQKIAAQETNESNPGRASVCRIVETSAIKPVSHPSKQLTVSAPQMALAFEGNGIIALNVTLSFSRVDGSLMQIPRSTMVYRLGTRFVVLLRFPFLAGAWYQLSFSTATEGHPTLEEDTLKYIFHAEEKIPSIVPSFNHPLMDKFGFPCVDALNTQSCGALVLAPRTFRIFDGTVYFLVFLDRSVLSNKVEIEGPGEEMTTKNQAQIIRKLRENDPLPQSDGCIDGLAVIHHAVAESIGSQVQSFSGVAHADISINGGQFLKPLWPRGDFPCLLEGLVDLGPEHLGNTVELFLRYPHSDKEYAPLKLAEWKVVKSEHFPQGF